MVQTPVQHNPLNPVASSSSSISTTQPDFKTSQSPAEADDSSTSNGKKRRAPQGSTSRGVANLTPDQLAKKRANDREAQRAIRERTKNQIETLERKIRDLTSQQPYQELQHALRQKEAVEAENADIRRRLGQVMNLIGPILGPGGNEAPTYTSQTSYLPYRPSSSSTLNVSTPDSVASLPASTWPNGGEEGRYPPNSNAQTVRQDMHLAPGQQKHGIQLLLENSQHSAARVPNGTNIVLPDPALNRVNPSPYSDLPFYSIPIHASPPTCPLDSLLLDFIHERRNSSLPVSVIAGPPYPSFATLLDPSVPSHPISKVITDILAAFTALAKLPERVATLYGMFLLLRWCVAPSLATYDLLPHWATPRVSQTCPSTCHPIWISFLPWPKMRDRLVQVYNPRAHLFDLFFGPFTETMSVHWPGGDEGVLMRSESGEVVMTEAFETHLRLLDNWSLGKEFAKAFPDLDGTYRLDG